MNVRCAFSRVFSIFVVLLLVSGMAPGSAHAAPKAAWVVNDEQDGVNGAADGTCDAYPIVAGNQCTLREAITEANASTGSDTITFSGNFTFQPATVYPNLTGDGITISGVGYTIVLDGTFVSLSTGLTLASTNNTIQGLRISGFATGVEVSSNDNLIGTDGDGINDGSEGNVIVNCNSAGVLITGSSAHHNVVAGNRIGTDDTVPLPNGVGVAIYAGAQFNTIGTNGDGSGDAVEGNLISGNSQYGVHIHGEGTNNNLLAGNLIGLNAAGNDSVSNLGGGVLVEGGPDDTIIGSNLDGNHDNAEGNVISGNHFHGIFLSGSGVNNTKIRGNLIGLSADGLSIVKNWEEGIKIDRATSTIIGAMGNGINYISGNQKNGILLEKSGNTYIQYNIIGQNTSSANAGNTGNGIEVSTTAFFTQINANTIAHNGGRGIFATENSGTRVYVINNTIYHNGGLGFDLYPIGPNPNDDGDDDSGPNDLLNYPVLDNVVMMDEDTVWVSGTLNSTPNTQFLVILYGNQECDPSNYGEGKYDFCEFEVNTDASGNASFSKTCNFYALQTNSIITATTLDASANVSEFSLCKAAVPAQNIFIPFVRR